MSIEMERLVFEEIKNLCQNFGSAKRAEKSDINIRFSSIMIEYDIDVNAIPGECVNVSSKSLNYILQKWLSSHGVIVKKRIWTEQEIKDLVQINDTVLYRALKQLYNCQTADEQISGHTKEYNGAGFNGCDSEFLSSTAEFLNRTGFLTDKQKFVVRKMLVKYTKQLTRLANK